MRLNLRRVKFRVLSLPGTKEEAQDLEIDIQSQIQNSATALARAI